MKEQLSIEQQRVSDYILRRIEDEGVDTVFGITGSYIANQLDAFSRNDKVQLVCTQHEQAAAMAAECYARLHPSKLGVTMVTSGPGATNLITGIYGSWFDSIPTLHITGQVGTFDLRGDKQVRQLGFQETDTNALLANCTKYTKQIRVTDEVADVMNEAIDKAREGRPGPVHIDLPIDLQMASFIPEEHDSRETKTETCSLSEIDRLTEMMAKAERPVLVVGNGIRLAGAEKEFRKLVDELDWPVLPSWGFADCLPDSDLRKIGLFGVYGNRGANFVVQNSDLVLAIGTRLDGRMTGRKEAFARGAKKVIVDVDRAEAEKNSPDLVINTDAKRFIKELLRSTRSSDGETWHQTERGKGIDLKEWKQRCLEWKDKYPTVKPEYLEPNGRVNPYAFSRWLSDVLPEGQVVIADCGGNLTYVMQAFQTKEGQRLISTFGNSPMGYALPAAIGAAFARPGEDIVCVIGDGGIQMNIQELQTIAKYKLPIKIFVFNNAGYGIIRQFQDSYIGGRHVGSEENNPDFFAVARAYGIKAETIPCQFDADVMRDEIRHVMLQDGPVLCDVKMLDTPLAPKAEFGNPIDEQSPKLSDEELALNLIVPRWQKKES